MVVTYDQVIRLEFTSRGEFYSRRTEPSSGILLRVVDETSKIILYKIYIYIYFKIKQVGLGISAFE